MYAYNFEANRIPGEAADSFPYWRDVGTIDAFYEANMDLNHVKPALNLYNREWPVRSTSFPDPPAKFVFDEEGRRGEAIDSIVSGGCILSGGMVRHSVLGRGVRVHTGAVVKLRHHGQLRHRAAREGSPRNPGQERTHSGRHRGGLRSRRGPRPRLARYGFRHRCHWTRAQSCADGCDVRLSCRRAVPLGFPDACVVPHSVLQEPPLHNEH